MVRTKKSMILTRQRWVLSIIFTFIIYPFFINTPLALAEENELQQLINQTPEYGILNLTDKVYEGNIVITKPLSLVGGKQTIIKGDGAGNVVSIKSPKVKLSKVTITNSGMSRNTSEEFAAIKIYTDYNVIDHVTIRESYHGVYLSQAHHNIVKDTQVLGENNGTIAGQGNGLHIYYSNQNRLENNKIEGTRDGMFFDYSNENIIVNNAISKTRYGLHYMYSNENQFYDNTFTFNTGGAAIMYSNQTKLKNNRFAFNGGTQSFGLLLQSANHSTIIDNQFYQNQRGLYIDQSSENEIESNQFFLNQIGIEMWASSNHQTMSKNNFSKNIAAVLQLGGKSDNQWSRNGIGNEWGDEGGLLDLNQDQIGDDPVQNESSLYKLIEQNELAYLFLNSPTIKIYEKFHEFLNQQQVMFTDEFPIVHKREGSLGLYFIIILIPLLPFFKRRFLK